MKYIPEWLYCENLNGRKMFILHTRRPRFICRYFDQGSAVEDPPFSGSDPEAPLRYDLQQIGEGWLEDFRWTDPPPTGEELFALLRAAERFVAEYDHRLGIE